MRKKTEWRYLMPLYITFVVAVVLVVLTACQSNTTAMAYDGSALFQGYCASCHGASGAGDGPVAPHLLTVLPDLKTMAQRSATSLNKADIISTIDGRTMRAVHGSKDMPVWGRAFLDMEASERETQARLDALANHILSIQE